MRKISLVITRICLVTALALLTDQAAMANLPLKNQAAIPRAKQLLQASVVAMGGEESLRALRAVKIEGIGHLNLLEQSERPEGPYLITYEQTTDLLDIAGTRLSEAIRSK